MKDELFKTANINSFAFNKDVVNVFDDMITRSVPLYSEIQKLIANLAKDFVQPNSNVYDLGCSTCNTFQYLEAVLDCPYKYIGIDSSKDMQEKAKLKLSQNHSVTFELKQADLNAGIKIENSSFVILNLVLQFIDPKKRHQVVSDIYQGLNKGGALVLFEKIKSEQFDMQEIYTKHYHQYKISNSYSQEEVENKAKALKNVLIPLSLEGNITLLKESGFSVAEPFFQWHNFVGILAIK